MIFPFVPFIFPFFFETKGRYLLRGNHTEEKKKVRWLNIVNLSKTDSGDCTKLWLHNRGNYTTQNNLSKKKKNKNENKNPIQKDLFVFLRLFFSLPSLLFFFFFLY